MTISSGVVISSVRLTSTSTPQRKDKNEIRLFIQWNKKTNFSLLFSYTNNNEAQKRKANKASQRRGCWSAFLKKLKLLTCTIQFSAFSKQNLFFFECTIQFF
jgi:hypothetical protein